MRYLGRLGGAALLAASAALALAARPAQAQDRTGTVEITPFGGGYFGGRLYAGSNSIFADDVDVRDAGTYGIRVGVNANRWLGIEAGFSKARGDIESVGGSSLFGSGVKLGELDVQHYELNMLFNMGRRRVIPYITLGAGVTRFDARVPDVDTSADTRFTANFGAGVKAFFDPHFGLRFDGRYRAAYVNDQNCNSDFSFCSDDHHHHNHDNRWYGSGELTGGVIFAF